MDELGKTYNTIFSIFMIVVLLFLGIIVWGGYKTYRYFYPEHKTVQSTEKQIELICSNGQNKYYITDFKIKGNNIIDDKTSLVFEKNKCVIN